MGGRDEPFLDFVEFDRGRHRTRRFRVKHVEGEELGVVKWHSPWRRYAFFPGADTLYDGSCLHELTTFIDQLMHEREEGS